MVQRFTDPQRSALRTFSQFGSKIPPAVVVGCICKLRQCGLLEKRRSERLKGILPSSPSRSGEGKAPGTFLLSCPDPSQDRKDAGPNQRSLAGTAGSQHQHEWLFRCGLLLQNIEQFSDAFRSAAKKRGIFIIKEAKPAKRVLGPGDHLLGRRTGRRTLEKFVT